MERLTGVVDRWFDDRGFGFIRPDDEDPEQSVRSIWFHAREVRNVDRPVHLQAGDVVEYTLLENERGPYAAKVYLLEPDDEPEAAEGAVPTAVGA